MVVWEKKCTIATSKTINIMKKLFYPLSLLLWLQQVVKDKETVCNLDAAGIVGSYKITSVLYKADASTPEVDLFTLYAACEKMTSSN